MWAIIFGVCDANMALLTVTSLDHLQKDGVFLLNKVNENPMVTLALYYVMPRSLMAVAFYYVSNSVNSIVRKSMENAIRMVQAASMDDMTGLYSKNKLLETVEHMEPKERPVAVIYWDVNQLKYVNDTFGHLYGDQLIAKIAGSIRAAVSEETNAYRYGGDEFLMIIPDGTQEIAEDVIEKWRQVMKPIQKNSEIPVSASVGYAVGKYENIMELIEIADQRMYKDKQLRRDVHGGIVVYQGTGGWGLTNLLAARFFCVRQGKRNVRHGTYRHSAGTDQRNSHGRNRGNQCKRCAASYGNAGQCHCTVNPLHADLFSGDAVFYAL